MFGLLGKTLRHSFSKEIHETMTNKPYKLFETANLKEFFNNTPFTGINVTIPYKHDVIQYVDELSTEAQETGAVNTIISRGGKLFGYNTDCYGLEKALELHDISLFNQEIIILGNGSTTRSIEYVCRKYLAKNITILARNPKENEYYFKDVENFNSATIMFNATPVGMFPNNNQDLLIDLDKLPNLISVIDVVYNPLRSSLLIEAKNRGIKIVNGLFMLISQAMKSMELFHNSTISDQTLLDYYRKLEFKMTNIALIGMPMSGKTFFAKRIASMYNKTFVDIDEQIEKFANKSIPEIFESEGETRFRNIESAFTLELSKRHNQAISCGGGIVLNPHNIYFLKQNSVLLFIDVPLSLLQQCNPKGRPLLKNKENLEKLYYSRYDLYHSYSDIIVHKTNFDESITMQEIEVKLHEYFNS